MITRFNGTDFDVDSYFYQLLDIGARLEVTARAADGAVIGVDLFDGALDGFADGGNLVVSNYQNVTSLTFDNVSTVAPGNARFDQISVEFEGPSPVPVPATGVMLLTALGAAAALRRKG